MTTLLKVAALLAPGDAKVAARVTLAEEEPAAYVAKYAKQLAERAITKPVPRLSFVALLDALEAGKKVALVDHRAAPEDVVHALAALKAPKKPTPGWARGIDDDDHDVPTVVSAAAAAWKDKGVVLVNLDTTSDQLAIAAIARDAVTAMKQAAKAAKLRIEVVEPKPLSAPPPVEEAPAKPMKSWPSAANDPPGTWRYFVQSANKRSVCLVKYPIAYYVHTGPLGGNSREEQRSFGNAKACTNAYLAHVEELRTAGWNQLSAADHAKASRAHR